ncbi:hypothetical protein RUM43_003000 [Polyplax serrata]|uniref:protein-histidine N-methyltransferase n=1 Tax=Polyplax serrata TaxID=468196 RepID=A0AAN8RWF1_POLSC
MVSASSTSAKNLFVESKLRLSDRVQVNVNNIAKIARQIQRGSKANENLIAAAKNFALQEAAIENSETNLKKLQLLTTHLNAQVESVQNSSSKVELVLEQVRSMQRVELLFLTSICARKFTLNTTMGRRNFKKSKNHITYSVATKSPTSLSPQKRNEINNIVKKLLKLTSQMPSDGKGNWETHVEIHKLFQKVQELEPAYDVSNKREDHFEDLKIWIKNNGGDIENISIKKFDGMDYGLEAVKDIREGDLICSIPRKVMMSFENIKNSPLEHLFKNDPILSNMGNVALALFLILEYLKGKDSFWYSYISSLPTSYNTVLYFELDDFLEMQYSPTFEPALKHCRNIARQYAYFNNLFQSSTDEASQILRNTFTYQLYR